MSEVIKHWGQIDGEIYNSDTTESTSSNSGSIRTQGGLGVSKSVFIDENLSYNGKLAPSVDTLRNNLSTGLISGGVISIATGAQINVSSGSGLIVNNHTNPNLPTVTDVEWTTFSNITITNPANLFTHIYINNSGNIIQSLVQPTPTLRRTLIYLGKIFTADSVNVTSTSSQGDIVLSPTNQSHDFWKALGPVIMSGLRVKANGANLSVDRTVGQLHQSGIGVNFLSSSPNIKDFSVETLVNFTLSKQDGPVSTSNTTITPGFYDLNGIVTAIPGSTNRATNQRVYFFANGFVTVQYGQQYYNSISDARAGIATETFIVEPNSLSNGVLIGIISVRSGATDLSLPTDAVISNASKFGEVSVGAAGTANSTLQSVYNNSTDPEIVLNSTLGGVSIQDATVTIGGNLFEIQDTLGAELFSVSNIGDLTLDGDLILNSGTISSTNDINIESTSGNIIIEDIIFNGSILSSTGSMDLSSTGDLILESDASIELYSTSLALVQGATAELNSTSGLALVKGLTAKLEGNGNVSILSSTGAVDITAATTMDLSSASDMVLESTGGTITLNGTTLPTSTGTNKDILSTNGSGITEWANKIPLDIITFGPSVSTPTFSGTRSCAWSEKNQFLVAVGESHVVKYDGNSVTATTLGLTAAPIRGIAYSPKFDMYVGVASNGKIYKSFDGTTWSLQTTNAGVWITVSWVSPAADINGIGFFAAVSVAGTSQDIITSQDGGLSWFLRSTPGSNGIVFICNSPELQLTVAVNETDARIYTSQDGITWSFTVEGTGKWRSICWSPELRLFCAASNTDLSGTGNGRVITSPDGVTWTSRNTFAGDNYSWNEIKWSSYLGQFLAVSTGGFMYSPDGINWTEYPITGGWTTLEFCNTFRKWIVFSSGAYSLSTVTEPSNSITSNESNVNITAGSGALKLTSATGVKVENTLISTSTDTGALVVNGGLGVKHQIHTPAILSNNNMDITSDGTLAISSTSGNVNIEDFTFNGSTISTAGQMIVNSTGGSVKIEDVTINGGNVTGATSFQVSGNLNVASISSSSANLTINNTVGTVQVESVLFNAGAVSGVSTINMSSLLTLGGNIVRPSGQLNINSSDSGVQVESVLFTSGAMTGVSNLTMSGDIVRPTGQLNINSSDAGVQVESVLFTSGAMTGVSSIGISGNITTGGDILNTNNLDVTTSGALILDSITSSELNSSGSTLVKGSTVNIQSSGADVNIQPTGKVVIGKSTNLTNEFKMITNDETNYLFCTSKAGVGGYNRLQASSVTQNNPFNIINLDGILNLQSTTASINLNVTDANSVNANTDMLNVGSTTAPNQFNEINLKSTNDHTLKMQTKSSPTGGYSRILHTPDASTPSFPFVILAQSTSDIELTCANGDINLTSNIVNISGEIHTPNPTVTQTTNISSPVTINGTVGRITLSGTGTIATDSFAAFTVTNSNVNNDSSIFLSYVGTNHMLTQVNAISPGQFQIIMKSADADTIAFIGAHEIHFFVMN